MQETFTITFGDQAENHAGMQKLGTLSEQGFEHSDLSIAQDWFEQRGIIVEQVNLNSALGSIETDIEAEAASILVARNGLSMIVDPDEFHTEQQALDKDSKAMMYGRVVNKRARYNLCFSDTAQQPDYAAGKGTVVAFDTCPLLHSVQNALSKIVGERAEMLVAEGNYYYDTTKCGIGFHGDTERRKVIAVRTGATLPLHFQWFHKSQPVGERIKLNLSHGDMYTMSEKAVGWDWKKRNSYTLRHAAGAPKYLKV